MADRAQALLHGLATAQSLSPFAQQLQAVQQLSKACRTRYSSEGTDMPDDYPSQQQVEAHCAATSTAFDQLALTLQQWDTAASSINPVGSSGSSTTQAGTSNTTATTAAPNSSGPSSTSPNSSSGNTAGQALPPQQPSQAALQAVLALTDATRHTIDAMRKLVSSTAQGGVLAALCMTGGGVAFLTHAGHQVLGLQDFAASIARSGLIPSFCAACDALAATLRHHPHLKPTPGLPLQQLHTLQQLHSLAASLFELFYILAAAWPPNDETRVQVDNTGLLNPTIRPIVLPAVRLCLAMLPATCGPASTAAAAPAPATAPTPPATAAPLKAEPTAPPAPAPTAAEAASLQAALKFSITLANILKQFTEDWRYTDRNTGPFVRAVLTGTGSSDGSVFQLMLSVLALTAHKLHRAAGGLSVWGDGTPVDAHHLQLLQEVGLAAPSLALLTSPDVTPYPYEDDHNNAVLVTACLNDVFSWNMIMRRDAYLAAHPGGSYRPSPLPLPLGKALSLTLLEAWMLVQREDYMRHTALSLLFAKSCFFIDTTEQEAAELMQLLEMAWCKALPGAMRWVQRRGRPLAYRATASDLETQSFMSEETVGEVALHYLSSAEHDVRHLLGPFVTANLGAAAAGAEWGFRHAGREVVCQFGPPTVNPSSDDPADNVGLAWQLLEHLLADAASASTPSDSTTISTQLQPALAAALATCSQDAQRLWLLLATLTKFAMAVTAERPQLQEHGAALLHQVALVTAAVLRAQPASSPSRGPACILLGRCLLGIGAAAAAAPAAAEWPRRLFSSCLAVVRLLGQELAAPGILPAALTATASGSTTGGSSSNSTTGNSSSAVPELLLELQAQQAALDDALAAARGDTKPIQPVLKQMQAYGLAVCALLPRPYCCNNPSCQCFAGHSELLLGHHKCSGCKAAAYCSRECQQAAWQAHKPVCKAIAAARPAKAAAAEKQR